MEELSKIIPYKLIALCGDNSEFAIVDAEDYDFLNRFKWFLVHSPRGMYTQTHLVVPDGDGNFERVSLTMHRMILSSKLTSSSTQVDHINHNGLDNRKSNLRVCSLMQNIHNSRKPLSGNNTYKGVYYRRNKRRWVAACQTNGVKVHIGSFNSEIEAAIAYNNHVISVRGEFAWVNPIQELKEF